MNIFVQHDWLLEHLDTPASPADIQRTLSLCGPSVERVHDLQGKTVYEIEVTTNRIDMASIRGIAREAAVILPEFGIPATLKPFPSALAWNSVTGLNGVSPDTFEVKVSDRFHTCSQVFAVMFHVKRQDSPDWMKQRLASADISSHGVLVDITNYLMLELGQPCHMFDADRVGKTMNIRVSKPGELFVALDGTEYTLPGNDIVVDNGEGMITDLIGIKGAANSGVVPETTRVLFFVERPDPLLIRKTSLKTGVRTDAAQLNEKQLDLLGPQTCMSQGMRLLRELADGEQISDVLDLHNSRENLKFATPNSVRYPISMTTRYLGISPDVQHQTSILEKLGCTVKLEELESNEAKQNGDSGELTLIVTPPTFRPDIDIPVDITEELARIIGYHNIPGKLMDTPIPTTKPANLRFNLEEKVCEHLAILGWQELLTYTHVSPELATTSGYPLDQHFRVASPLTEEHQYMRRATWPSLVSYLQQNSGRGMTEVYELGPVYHPSENQDVPAVHEQRLSLVTSHSYNRLLTTLRAVFSREYIELHDWEVRPSTSQPDSDSVEAELVVRGEVVGKVLATQGMFIAELVWDKFASQTKLFPEYQPISGFQPIIEDATLLLDDSTSISQVLHTIRSMKYVQKVELVAQFQRNFSFRIWFFSRETQLSAADIAESRQQVQNLSQANR